MNRAMLLCVAAATLALSPSAIAAPDCYTIAHIQGNPAAVAVNHAGDRILADVAGDRILIQPVYAPETLIIGRAGSNPGEFLNPSALAVGPGNEILIADAGNHRIQVLARDGAFLRQWGGHGPGPGQFRSPRGLAVDRAGLVYVSDAHNYRIQVFDLYGNLIRVTSLATPVGDGHREPVELLGMRGAVSSPPGALAVDPDGTLYVLEPRAGLIHVLDRFGTRVDVWGAAGSGRHRAFTRPTGIGVCPGSGLLYVSDAGAGEVRVLTPTGYDLSAWSAIVEPSSGDSRRPPGDDVAVPLGDPVQPTLRLHEPGAITVGIEGSILVADGSSVMGFAFRRCPVRVPLDLAPESCGGGRVVQPGSDNPVVVHGSAGSPMSQVDVGSLVFNSGWVLTGVDLDDVSGCVLRNGVSTPLPPDGYPDLLAMVGSQVWSELLEAHRHVEVTVRGHFVDGTPFWGVDQVRVTEAGDTSIGKIIDHVEELAYHLDRVTLVRAVVYDVSGRRVADLLQATQGPGDHVVVWDTRGAPGGIYFLELRAGDQHRTAKVVVRR